MSDQPDKTKIDLSINRTTLFFGLVITGLIISFISWGEYKGYYEVQFRDYIAVFTCGIVCTTLFYHSKNIKLTHAYHKERLEFEQSKLDAEKTRIKQEASLKICSEWFKPGMCEHSSRARLFLNNNKDEIKSPQRFIQVLDGNPEDRKAVVTMLNYFEHIALLIEKGIVDEGIVKDAFKTLFCDYYKLLRPYIEERQNESPRLLVKYVFLARKWGQY